MQHRIKRDPSVCERRCADINFTGWCFCMRAPSPSGARQPVVSRICHIFSCSRPQPQTLSSGNRQVTAIWKLSRSLSISNLVFISPSDPSCWKCISVSTESHMRCTQVARAIISCLHTMSSYLDRREMRAGTQRLAQTASSKSGPRCYIVQPMAIFSEDSNC